MPTFFISYRRDDSAGHAGRLHDRLVEHFGRENIFIDVDTIGPGADFSKAIRDAVEATDGLIAVIGREWLSATDANGARRLDDPQDFVRLEISTALELETKVIPVLVQGAPQLRAADLPDDLQKLANLNSVEVSDTRFHSDVDRLIDAMSGKSSAPASGSAINTLRLLLVEDSEIDAELVVRELRSGGYEPDFQQVETAAAMQSALERQSWDLVLTDFNMPNFSAMGALTVLQNSGLDLPIIIVSGTIGEDTAVAAMKAGAHDFVMKNNLARLVPAVERELREAEARRTRHESEEEERRLNSELGEKNERLEEQVKELSSLNTELQKQLEQRSQLRQAHQAAREGLKRLSQEAADLAKETDIGPVPEINLKADPDRE